MDDTKKLFTKQPELEQLSERITVLENEQTLFLNMAREWIVLGDELAAELDKTAKECARLQMQVNYLNARNQRYERIFLRIDQTWYGKILKKIYHVMQKMGWI